MVSICLRARTVCAICSLDLCVSVGSRMFFVLVLWRNLLSMTHGVDPRFSLRWLWVPFSLAFDYAGHVPRKGPAAQVPRGAIRVIARARSHRDLKDPPHTFVYPLYGY